MAFPKLSSYVPEPLRNHDKEGYMGQGVAIERERVQSVWEPSVWKSASSRPSHPNSSFNLVHDHLKQCACSREREYKGWAPLVHARLHYIHVPAVFISPSFPFDVTNSLPSSYYHRKKRTIVNLALSNAFPFTSVKTHREFSIEWSRGIPRNSITRRELKRQGRAGSNLLRFEKLAWRARLKGASALMNFLSAPVASKLLVASPITGRSVKVHHYYQSQSGN